MKLNLLLLAGACFFPKAQTPEILYYKFEDTGTTVTNLALNPPAGAATASLLGSVTQSPTGDTCMGQALTGTNASALTDYLSTNWNLSLSGSWSIHFKVNNYTYVGTQLNYLLGDSSTGAAFRLFTNGVAGQNNLMLRGSGITDLTIPGVFPVTGTPKSIAIVYDNTTQQLKGYINGTQVATANQASPLVINGNGFRVGGYGNATATFGLNTGMTMDEFGLFSRALTQAEVQSLADYCVLSTSETVIKQKSQVTVADGHLVTSESKFGDYEILDMSGRLIRKGNSRTNKINIAGLDRGVYLIKTAESSTRFVH